MTNYRDAAGLTLDDYPRPSVAVDTAVLTFDDQNRLCVLLVGSTGSLRLPGTFLHEGETLAIAVLRSLRDKASIEGLSPRQLHVFDDPARDDRGWVLSVAHLDVLPYGDLRLGGSQAQVVPVGELPEMPYSHGEIVALAVARLRAEYSEQPDPAGMLSGAFTLRTLHALHEAVAGKSLPRDTFRRAMRPLLLETGATSQGIVGKPAQTFTVRSMS